MKDVPTTSAEDYGWPDEPGALDEMLADMDEELIASELTDGEIELVRGILDSDDD